MPSARRSAARCSCTAREWFDSAGASRLSGLVIVEVVGVDSVIVFHAEVAPDGSGPRGTAEARGDRCPRATRGSGIYDVAIAIYGERVLVAWDRRQIYLVQTCRRRGPACLRHDDIHRFRIQHRHASIASAIRSRTRDRCRWRRTGTRSWPSRTATRRCDVLRRLARTDGDAILRRLGGRDVVRQRVPSSPCASVISSTVRRPDAHPRWCPRACCDHRPRWTVQHDAQHRRRHQRQWHRGPPGNVM